MLKSWGKKVENMLNFSWLVRGVKMRQKKKKIMKFTQEEKIA